MPHKSIIKWAGSKRKLLDEIVTRLPIFDSYYEPFCGSACVYFNLVPSCSSHPYYLNDINAELINVYNTVKTSPGLLILELKQFKNTEREFLKIRNVDRLDEYKRWSSIEKAARFIFLNKTAFNGLYRVNSKGQFNVPYGHYTNPTIVDEQTIMSCSESLGRAILTSKPFDEHLYESLLMRKDIDFRNVFVYLDPPYIPISDSSNFTAYTKTGFSLDDQKLLLKLCNKMTNLGIKWMQSNSASDIVVDLYKNYEIDMVQTRRSISASSKGRGIVNEALIRNY